MAVLILDEKSLVENREGALWDLALRHCLSVKRRGLFERLCVASLKSAPWSSSDHPDADQTWFVFQNFELLFRTQILWRSLSRLEFGAGGLLNGPDPVGGPPPLVQLVDGQPGSDEGRAASEVLLGVQGPAARTCRRTLQSKSSS